MDMLIKKHFLLLPRDVEWQWFNNSELKCRYSFIQSKKEQKVASAKKNGFEEDGSKEGGINLPVFYTQICMYTGENWKYKIYLF